MNKALFFDIDGTLVSFRTHQISDEDFHSLQILREKGIRLYIATGRGKDGLACLHGFPFDGYITLNGQYCFNDREILYENTIDPGELKIFLSILKEHPFPAGFVFRSGKVFNYRDARVDEVNAITHNDGQPAGDLSHVLEEPVYQIMAFISEEEEKQILQRMKGCTAARWYPSFCDISPKGGTKVKGMDCFAAHDHFDLKDTMAFGDGGNDLQMLEHAGTAVAMGNGDPVLKEQADYITDDVDHNGITKALQHYHLIG